MKKKNLPHFFYGCIAGAVLSSTLFFFTHYAGELRGVAQRHSQQAIELLQRNLHLGTERELEQNSRGHLLPVVFSPLSQATPTHRIVQKTWGQTVPDWVIAVGISGLGQEWLDDEQDLQEHLLMAEKCQDFSSNVHPSPEDMFCLMSAIYEAYHFRYDWIVIVTNTTYLAINRLSTFLDKLDPNTPFYLGNPSRSSDHCSMENGVVMSRAALRDITPHLSWCLRDKLFATNSALEHMDSDEREKKMKENKAGDVALGCCMKKVLMTSCSGSILIPQVSQI